MNINTGFVCTHVSPNIFQLIIYFQGAYLNYIDFRRLIILQTVDYLSFSSIVSKEMVHNII